MLKKSVLTYRNHIITFLQFIMVKKNKPPLNRLNHILEMFVYIALAKENVWKSIFFIPIKLKIFAFSPLNSFIYLCWRSHIN